MENKTNGVSTKTEVVELEQLRGAHWERIEKGSPLRDGECGAKVTLWGTEAFVMDVDDAWYVVRLIYCAYGPYPDYVLCDEDGPRIFDDLVDGEAAMIAYAYDQECEWTSQVYEPESFEPETPSRWLANVTPEMEFQEIGSVGAWTLYVDDDRSTILLAFGERILAAYSGPYRLTNALLYAHGFLEGEVPTDLIL